MPTSSCPVAEPIRVPAARIAPRPAFRESGMTLVEVLVVLAIIAVAASLSVLAIGSDDGLRGRAEAKRIEAMIQLAADRTMIEGGMLGLSVTPDGYGFRELDTASGEWQPSDDDALAEYTRLPAGMVLSSDSDEPVLPLGVDSAGRPFTLTLSQGDRAYRIAFDGMTARMQPQ